MRDFLNVRWHVAKKVHTCDSCGKEIQVGGKYLQQLQSEDDGFGVYRLHSDCDEAEHIVFSYIQLEYGETMTRVREMDIDDRETVKTEAPELAARLWP